MFIARHFSLSQTNPAVDLLADLDIDQPAAVQLHTAGESLLGDTATGLAYQLFSGTSLTVNVLPGDSIWANAQDGSSGIDMVVTGR